MYGYIAFYNNKTWELYADSLYEAKEKAIAHFKVPKSKRTMVSVVLALKENSQVETVLV